MRYLDFFNKLEAANNQNIGIDELFLKLTKDEQNYLKKNFYTLSARGGMEIFLNEFAGILDIDTKNITAQQRNQGMRRKLEEAHDSDSNPYHEKFFIWLAVLDHLATEGKGKALEELVKISPTTASIYNAPFMALEKAATKGKYMHYLLHESPERKAITKKLIDSVDEHDCFNENPSIYFKKACEAKDELAVKAMLEVLPLEKRQHILDRPGDYGIYYKHGEQIAKVALDYYPRNLIGTPPPNANEDFYKRHYKDAVRDQDEILFSMAALHNHPEMMRAILSQYPEPEKRKHILNRDGENALKNACKKGNIECVKIICEAKKELYGEDIRIAATELDNICYQMEHAAYAHDSELYRTLQRGLPPQHQHSTATKEDLSNIQLIYDLSSLTHRSQIVERMAHSHHLQIQELLSRTKDTNLETFEHLARLCPDEFQSHLKLSYGGPGIHADTKQYLLKLAPADRKQEFEKLLDSFHIRNDIHIASLPTNHQLWKKHFKDASWLTELPDNIKEKSPDGFDIATYKSLLPAIDVARKIEGFFEAAETQSFKLAKLFTSPKKAEQYLAQAVQKDCQHAIHDALLFDLPKKGHFDKESWQQFATRKGMGQATLKLLALAPRIEKAFAGKPSNEWNDKTKHAFRQLTHEKLIDIAKDHAYSNSDKNPELAKLCVSLGVEEHYYEAARKLFENAPPTKNTPNINVDGTGLGFPGFHFKRLEATDPRCAFIGKMVNCCNYLGGFTETMAIAQVQHPDCSLYVLTNRDGEPVAKCTGWMSEKGNLVFNAWERLSSSYDKMCEPFLLAASIQAMKYDPNINRVTLGTNKGNANFPPITDAEKPKAEETASGDSLQQYQIAAREKLKLATVKLAELSKKHRPEPKVKLDVAQIWQLRQREDPNGSRSIA